ncbi:hypothetical protein RFI_16808, partial [Reticulomyxa filosa]
KKKKKMSVAVTEVKKRGSIELKTSKLLDKGDPLNLRKEPSINQHWSCPLCTYSNPLRTTTCDVCGTSKLVLTMKNEDISAQSSINENNADADEGMTQESGTKSNAKETGTNKADDENDQNSIDSSPEPNVSLPNKYNTNSETPSTPLTGQSTRPNQPNVCYFVHNSFFPFLFFLFLFRFVCLCLYLCIYVLVYVLYVRACVCVCFSKIF